MTIGVGFRRQGNQGEKTELLQPARERKSVTAKSVRCPSVEAGSLERMEADKAGGC